jgi:hypothetical protein
VNVSYSDQTASGYGGSSFVAVTNGIIPVAACPAPPASTIRDIDYVSIVNMDNVANTATVSVDVNGTAYPLVVTQLEAGNMLSYTHASGWRTLSADGAVIQKVISTMSTLNGATFESPSVIGSVTPNDAYFVNINGNMNGGTY